MPLWLEAFSRVVKHGLPILEEHDHLRVVRMLGVTKLQRDHDEIGTRPIDVWSDIDLGMRWVPAGELDDLNVPTQVHHEKMARVDSGVTMTDDGIGLIRAWPTVVQIIQTGMNPREQQLPQEYQDEGDEHPRSQREEFSASAL